MAGNTICCWSFGPHRYLASPIAIELSIVSNFLINNYWTFADRVTVGSKRIRGLKFNLVSLLALAVSYTTLLALSLLLPRVAPVWLQGLAIVPAVLVNYLLNSTGRFVSRAARKRPTPGDDQPISGSPRRQPRAGSFVPARRRSARQLRCPRTSKCGRPGPR